MSVKICPQCMVVVPGNRFDCPHCFHNMTNVLPAFKKCPACGKKVPAEKEKCPCGLDMAVVDLFLVCPSCGAKQLADENTCTRCGHSFVKTKCVMVRICSCGMENREEAEKCHCCGRPVIHTVLTESGSVFFLFQSVDQRCCVGITREPVKIGHWQETCTEYLKAKIHVSREHLKLAAAENGMLEATDISSWGTWLNDGQMTKDSPVFVDDGDEFSLSGPSDAEYAACFRVVRVRREEKEPL